MDGRGGNQGVDQRGVEDVLIGLLAELAEQETQQEITPEELRALLITAGEDLPIDSVIATAIVGEVQAHFGIRLPPPRDRDRYLSSVRAFAAKVCAQMTLTAGEEVLGA